MFSATLFQLYIYAYKYFWNVCNVHGQICVYKYAYTTPPTQPPCPTCVVYVCLCIDGCNARCICFSYSH